MKAVAAIAALLVASAHPASSATECPAPIPDPTGPGVAANSTYYSDALPPARFSHVPTHEITVRFGQAAIDNLCGRPPCGLRYVACTSGNVMALPDPFTTGPRDFTETLEHELGHVNGWPASHGD